MCFKLWNRRELFKTDNIIELLLLLAFALISHTTTNTTHFEGGQTSSIQMFKMSLCCKNRWCMDWFLLPEMPKGLHSRTIPFSRWKIYQKTLQTRYHLRFLTSNLIKKSLKSTWNFCHFVVVVIFFCLLWGRLCFHSPLRIVNMVVDVSWLTCSTHVC